MQGHLLIVEFCILIHYLRVLELAHIQKEVIRM